MEMIFLVVSLQESLRRSLTKQLVLHSVNIHKIVFYKYAFQEYSFLNLTVIALSSLDRGFIPNLL